MISDERAARRLARAILADVKLYQGEASLRAPAALAEGRTLFRSRVSASLAHVFDEELRGAGGPGGASSGESPSAPEPASVTVDDGPGLVPALLVGAALAIVAAAGAAAYLLAR